MTHRLARPCAVAGANGLENTEMLMEHVKERGFRPHESHPWNFIPTKICSLSALIEVT